MKDYYFEMNDLSTAELDRFERWMTQILIEAFERKKTQHAFNQYAKLKYSVNNRMSGFASNDLECISHKERSEKNELRKNDDKFEGINPEEAFIPIVELIESKNYQYVFENLGRFVYELDSRIDSDKRNQSVKKLRIITEEPSVSLTFKVTKGNKLSKDEDGIVRANIYYSNREMEEKEFDTSYGATFDLEVNVKKLAYIKFYANDNSYFGITDGGVSNVFCGFLNYDSQKPLQKQAVKAINHLSDEQKAIFMATVLCESGNGKKELWDIAYIYLNLVNIHGFEVGMKKSSAYEQKSYVYRCHLRHLEMKWKKYNQFNDWDKIQPSGKTMEDQTNEYKNNDDVRKFIQFCKTNIFKTSPTSLYKDWEGQGNFTDMNLRMHNDKREIWAMASQYFHLQNQGKVKEKLVVELLDTTFDRGTRKDGTSYIFHKTKIIKYFNQNPENLPLYQNGDVSFSKTGKTINEKSSKNLIPPVYGFRKQ